MTETINLGPVWVHITDATANATVTVRTGTVLVAESDGESSAAF